MTGQGGNTRVWPLPNMTVCAVEPHSEWTETLSSKSKALPVRLFPAFFHFISAKSVSCTESILCPSRPPRSFNFHRHCTTYFPRKLLLIPTPSQYLLPGGPNWHSCRGMSQQQEPGTQAGDTGGVISADPSHSDSPCWCHMEQWQLSAPSAAQIAESWTNGETPWLETHKF